MIKSISLVIVLCLSYLLISAQNNPKPEYENILYYWNKASNELTETEKKSTKLRATAYKRKYIIEGAFSSCKISDQRASFMISSGSPALINYAKIYKTTSKKGKRSFEPITVGWTKTDMDGDAIAIRTKKLNDGLYVLSTDKPLDKGEYAVYGLSSTEVFLFSIN